MSTVISPGNSSSSALLESAVFALDRWLRWRNGVFEYSLDPQCVFRLEPRRADDTLVLADGTCLRAGARVLVLHLWNEHFPLMGRSGPTVGWAHKVSRAMRASLCELVRYLAQRSELSDIGVLYADVRVSSAAQAARAARMMARFGFETANACVDRRRAPQRMADAMFVLLMAGVTNPRTLRGAFIRHANVRVFMSRAVLEKRYAARGADRKSSSEWQSVNPAFDDPLSAPPDTSLSVPLAD